MAARPAGAEVELARGAAEYQRRGKPGRDKCQYINVNEKHGPSDDTSRGYSGDENGATCGGEKTQNKQNYQDVGVSYKLVPPDGGWGWMVVLGTFIIMTLLPAVGPCFGVLFSGYLLGAGSSSTTTAWIFNLQCFLWFTSGLFTRPLTQELGWRPVALTGSMMGCLGMMLSAFTPNPNFLFFSFSILTGIGGGVVTCQCFTILPHYFQRLRGLTNALMMSGICLGQIAWPPVARYLQDNYGFRGATLIIGAVMFNSCIGASFFHPYERHQKKVMVEEEQIKENNPPTMTKAMESPRLIHELVQSRSESSFVGSTVEVENDGNLVVKARLLGQINGWRTSVSSSRQLSRYNSNLSLSSMDVGTPAIMPLDDEQEKAYAEAQKVQKDMFPVRVVKSIRNDLGVLRSLRACILCFGAVMCINGFLNFIMMVPFAMLEAGFSKDTAAWCVSLSAVCNLVSRFMVSALSDIPRFSKRIAYLCGFMLVSSSMLAFTFLATEEGLLAAMAVYGVGVGASMGVYNLVIIDVMGMESLSSVFGAANFCIAIGFIIIGPLIGFIRDVTQSYAVSMQITAGMLLVGLTAWMFMRVAERADQRREAIKTLKEKPWQT